MKRTGVRGLSASCFALLLAACHATELDRGLGASCGEDAPCAAELVCTHDAVCRPACADAATCGAGEVCGHGACIPRRARFASCAGDADDQTVNDAIVDGAGNLIVAGGYRGTLDLGGGVLSAISDGDMFIAKFGPAGEHLWSRSFGGSDPKPVDDAVLELAVDAAGDVFATGFAHGIIDFGGGPLVAASAGSDIALLKLDAGGQHVWSRIYGPGRNDSGRAIAATPDGGVVFGGHFGGCGATASSIDFGGGPLVCPLEMTCAFLSRYDAAGDHVFSTTFLSQVGQTCTGGGVICPDVNAPQVPTCNQSVEEIAARSDGGFAVSGNYDDGFYVDGSLIGNHGGNVSDLFVAQYAPNDTPEWWHGYGGTKADGVLGLALDPAGRLAASGYSASPQLDLGGAVYPTQGTFAAFAAEYDVSGAYLASLALNGGAGSAVLSLGTTFVGDGRLVVALMFNGELALPGGTLVTRGGYDIALLVVDASGAPLAVEQIGGPADDSVEDIAVADGDVVLGFTGGNGVLFADEKLVTHGGKDVCIGRLPLDLIGR